MNDDYLMTLLGITIIAVIISLTITTSLWYWLIRYQVMGSSFKAIFTKRLAPLKIDKVIIKGYLAMSTWLFLVIWAVCIIIDSFVTCEGISIRQYHRIPWC